jgi:hypothetical protein
VHSYALHLALGQRALLVPDRVGDAESPDVVEQSRSAQLDGRRLVTPGEPSGPGRERGDAARVAGRVGRLEVGEVSDRLQRRVEVDAGQRRGQGWLRGDHRLPAGHLLDPAQQRINVLADVPGQGRVELPSGAAARDVDGHLDPSQSPEDLEDVGEHHDARRQPDPLALQLVGGAPAVPALEHLLQVVAHCQPQPQPRRELTGDQAVGHLHRGQRAAAGGDQGCEQPRASPRRLTAADVTQHEARHPEAGLVGAMRVVA